MKIEELFILEEERKELEKKREDLQELMKNIGSIDHIDLVYKFNKISRFYVVSEIGRAIPKEEQVITKAMKKAECEAIKELTADIDTRLEQIKETADKANKLLEDVAVPAPKTEQKTSEPAITSDMMKENILRLPLMEHLSMERVGIIVLIAIHRLRLMIFSTKMV